MNTDISNQIWDILLRVQKDALQHDGNMQLLDQDKDCALVDIEKLFPQWIPVSERLLEFQKEVIAYFPVLRKYYHERQFVILFKSAKGELTWRTMDGANEYDFSYATHWMPLPELPEGK